MLTEAVLERLVSKLKEFRRVATRYDKLDPYCLASVQIASAVLWLCISGGTAQSHRPGLRTLPA